MIKAREAKRMKLANMGRQSYVSQQGLQKLLQEVQNEGLPDAFSTRTQRRCRKALCSKMTPYGSIVEHIEVPRTKQKPLALAVQNPCAMLWTAVRDCRVFSELAHETCNTLESKHIILYIDVISPADGLKTHMTRGKPQQCIGQYRNLESEPYLMKRYGSLQQQSEHIWGVDLRPDI